MNKILLLLAYISIIILANYTASNIIELPLGINLAVGTIFFGFVFTVRDKLHQFGKPTVYLGIALASALSLILNLITSTPLQIIVASLVGLILGELADTEIFDRVKKNWLIKSLSSNSISVPLDSILFNVIAFVGTDLAVAIPGLIVGDIIFKGVFSTILALSIWSFKSKKYLVI